MQQNFIEVINHESNRCQSLISELSDKHYTLKLDVSLMKTDIENINRSIGDLYTTVNKNTSAVSSLDNAYDVLLHNYHNIIDRIDKLDHDLDHKIEMLKFTDKTLGNMNIQQNEEIDTLKTLLNNVAAQLQQMADHFNQLTK